MARTALSATKPGKVKVTGKIGERILIVGVMTINTEKICFPIAYLCTAMKTALESFNHISMTDSALT